MIVRDEEHNLEACLAPVANLFDEIIIVDTGSTDATKTIARKYTPHVFDFQWCDDFARARNETLRHASGDWIFWLDADDRIDKEQVARLAKLLGEELGDQPRAYLMDTVMPAGDPGCDDYITSHPRLFRRHADLRWQGRVHEQLFPDPISLGYQWVYTDIQIIHVGYLDRALSERKARRKLRLLRMDFAVDPENHSTLLHLSLALVALGKCQEARKLLLRLQATGDASQPYMRRVYRALAEIALHQGQPHEAVKTAALGLSQFANDEQLLFAQASAYYSLEEYEQCANLLEALLHLPPSGPRFVISAATDMHKRGAPRMLCAVRRMQGRFAEAEAAFDRVLAHFPDDLIALYNLGLVYLDQQDGAKLAALIQKLIKIKAGRVNGGTLAALWHLRNGLLPRAGELIESLIAEAPHLPAPRMLRAEWLSRSGASWSDQARALKDLLRVQPGNLEAQRWLQAVQERQHLAAAPMVLPATINIATAHPVG
jgi:tetratricopeptide (TPR) repeat protein